MYNLLAKESGIDLVKSAPQLEVARNLQISKGVKDMEDIKELLHLQQGFPEVYNLIEVAMIIPVTSATAERSFSVLKRIDILESYNGTGKTYTSCSTID